MDTKDKILNILGDECKQKQEAISILEECRWMLQHNEWRIMKK